MSTQPAGGTSTAALFAAVQGATFVTGSRVGDFLTQGWTGPGGKGVCDRPLLTAVFALDEQEGLCGT